jgi:hypothetical protein
MNYSTLATVAVSLAILAVAVAGVSAVLRCAGRRRSSDRGLTVMLVVLAGAAAVAFVDSAVSSHDLQSQSRRALSLAVSAERAALARSGRYTTSVARLRRLSPALRTEMLDQGATVIVVRGRVRDSIRVRATLGFGSSAGLTLRPAAHVNHLALTAPG